MKHNDIFNNMLRECIPLQLCIWDGGGGGKMFHFRNG